MTRTNIEYAVKIVRHFMVKPEMEQSIIDSFIRKIKITRLSIAVMWNMLDIEIQDDQHGMFNFGSTVVSWYSNKQLIVSWSAVETKYSATAMGAQENT